MIFSDGMALINCMFERSEFTVLAMEYDKIILILCASSSKHRMTDHLISTQYFNRAYSIN
ncbi:hypothetical protein [Clostridium manihotivorum]|uniref:hypothetical protein n=1 Tax=Clostridium manihotivorum TaxID=2320868 RepID=UPI000FE33ECB|nr:hypothetical protein [Clostridium manihotivorum]